MCRCLPGRPHTCGVGVDRRLFCWGNNSSGALVTHPSILDSASFTFPVGTSDSGVAISPGSGFTLALDDAGWAHARLITTEGALRCWGDATWG